MKRPKALVIDDDPGTLDHVAEVLESLGHTHEQAGSLQQARRLLAANSYDYIILNLMAPARPRKGIRRIQNGVNFLEGTLLAMGDRAPPVIVLVDGRDEDHAKRLDLVELAAAMMAKGAAYAVTKPLKADGRALDKAIKKALAVKRPFGPPHKRPPPAKGARPRPFEGGELAFYTDRVELCGVKILGDTGTGESRRILEVLSHKDGERYVRVGGGRLAKEIGATGGIGTVTGCVKRIRQNVARRLREELGLTVGNQDFIANDRRHGYWLKEWISIGKPAKLP